MQPPKDTRKYHFCPFEGCNRSVKHPEIVAEKRRVLCVEAKVAKGRGLLKKEMVSKQQTLLSAYSQPVNERGDEVGASGGSGLGLTGLEEESGDEDNISDKGGEPGEKTGDEIEEESGDKEGDRPGDEVEEGSGDKGGDKPGDEVMASGGLGESDDEEVLIELSDEEVAIENEFPADLPFLVGLRDHLTSRHGKGRSQNESKQISASVSRYLKFAGPGLLNPSHLSNAKLLDKYMKTLEVEGKKASTQHATLSRIKQGLTYLNLSLDPADSIMAEKTLTVISNWSSVLGKGSRKTKRANLEDMAIAPTSMAEIDKFVNSHEMSRLNENIVSRMRKGETVAQADLSKAMVWLAGCLLHSNAQRPGAVTNATLNEFHAATTSTIGRETYLTILVTNHKTSTTGRAKLSANKHLAHHLRLYIRYIRPALEGTTSCLLFPNKHGKQLDHISRHVDKLARTIGVDLPHAATATRHITASALMDSSDAARSVVAVAMSHSKRTQELQIRERKTQ